MSILDFSQREGLSKKEDYVLGIDEAGRGPVMGPMVYGACWCPCSKEDQLRPLGVNDSKQLTPAKRDSLYSFLTTSDYTPFALRNVTAEEISTSMLRREKISLNQTSHAAAVSLIFFALENGFSIKKVFVDTVGDPDKYREHFERVFDDYPQIEFVVTKKADSKFPIVGAASICAKVFRDREIEKIVGESCEDKCSGYPSDAATRRWLLRHLDPVFGWSEVVRFSWGTCREYIDKGNRCGGVVVSWPSVEDPWEEEGEGNTQKKKKDWKGGKDGDGRSFGVKDVKGGKRGKKNIPLGKGQTSLLSMFSMKRGRKEGGGGSGEDEKSEMDQIAFLRNKRPKFISDRGLENSQHLLG
eukprot:TRINITY_DN27929_c0_g1_i1.p1 TRINITY_DN27929_c0_g1~~TRINITY_DN27929_c0_g1_i1.p1  ORF type:complete len:355 (-),score=95.23 TRINITY_DN27929_c0_g1_i1:53-1117(-)